MTDASPPRLGAFPVHVLFWAAFPVLALWNQNSLATPPGEAVAVLWPLLVVALVAAVVLALPVRSLRRGALAIVVILVPSTLYGYAFTNPADELGLVVWGLIVAAGLAATIRISGDTLQQLTAGLNVVSLVLVLLNGVPAMLGARDRQAALDVRQEQIVSASGSARQLPDIWYLVPDRYGRADTLEDIYGVDNSAFVGALRGLGFQVFDQAATNYPQSLTSLSATLNLDYHDDPANPADRTSAELALFNDHLVGRTLKAEGYEYVHLGNWADFSQSAASADRVITTDAGSAFGTEFADLTVLPAIEALFANAPAVDRTVGQFELQQVHAGHQLRALDELAGQDPDHPQFVFAHLILPHPPFIFDADGSTLTPGDVSALGWTEAYSRQLAFTNSFLEDLVRRLTARAEPPIIIIQADEGPLPERFYELSDEPFALLSSEQTRLHNSVMSAAYVPTGSLPLSEDEPVTSINVVRAVIAHVLGQPFVRLDDHSYTFERAWDSPYVDVTDLVFGSSS